MTNIFLREMIQQVLLMCYILKQLNTYPDYILKHNLKKGNQIIFLMMQSGKGCHCLSVMKLSILLSHDGDFSGLNFRHSFITKPNLSRMKNI